jgi:hypothetical protein
MLLLVVLLTLLVVLLTLLLVVLLELLLVVLLMLPLVAPPAPLLVTVDKTGAASDYVYASVKKLGAMTSVNEIDAWYAAQAERIAKLKLGYPDQYRELMAGMTAQRAAVSKVAAE